MRLFLFSIYIFIFLASTNGQSLARQLTSYKQDAELSYILGPGDTINLDFEGIPELSGSFTIGPDGNLYLPRIKSYPASGLTLDQLSARLEYAYSYYIINPSIVVSQKSYRTVRVLIRGEVVRPGYYNLTDDSSGDTGFDFDSVSVETYFPRTSGMLEKNNINGFASSFIWPRLFDALRASGGVTAYSDLRSVKIIRNLPSDQEGDKLTTSINFLDFLDGTSYQSNIKLYDGDIVQVSKLAEPSPSSLQIATQTNMSPRTINVFVFGRVNRPGNLNMPQGSTLNQAIAAAGGTKILKGSIEFLRIKPNQPSDVRRFSYKPGAAADDKANPILISGDIVRVNNSLMSSASEALGELTAPVLGLYSIYAIFGR